jgi:putative FmdB family regulatory protein
MPIYEYQCQQCGNHFEIMQKISDAPLSECQTCGGALEKQWSQTSFQLKGGGWYVSDYGKGGNGPVKKTDGESPATDKSETPKTDAPAKSEPASSGADKVP